MYQRSRVRIPAPFTGWTFFTFICCECFNLCLKRRRGRGWPIGLKRVIRLELTHLFLKTFLRFSQFREFLETHFLKFSLLSSHNNDT